MSVRVRARECTYTAGTLHVCICMRNLRIDDISLKLQKLKLFLKEVLHCISLLNLIKECADTVHEVNEKEIRRDSSKEPWNSMN